MPTLQSVLGARLLRSWANSATVSTWTDDQGVANAVQATSARQGTVVTTPAGKNALSIDSDGLISTNADVYVASGAGTNAAPNYTMLGGVFSYAAGATNDGSGFAVIVAGGARFIVYISTTDSLLRLGGLNSIPFAHSSVTVQDGKLHRFVAILDNTGSAGTLYLDGTAQIQDTGTGDGLGVNLSTTTVTIGANDTSGTLPFMGTIGDVFIAQSGSVFSAADISSADRCLAEWIQSVNFANAGAAATGTTSLALPYPSPSVAGTMLLAAIVNKYPTNGPSTPTGWTLVDQGNGGVGTAGADSGTVYTTVFSKIADGTESGSLSVTIASGNTAIGRITSWTKPDGTDWVAIANSNGAKNTAGTAFSVTAGANPGLTKNDTLVMVAGTNTSLRTYSAEAVTATGVSAWGNVVERQDSTSALGDHCELVISEHPVATGTSSAAPVFTMTASGTAANQNAGSAVFVRLRTQAIPVIPSDWDVDLTPRPRQAATQSSYADPCVQPVFLAFGEPLTTHPDMVLRPAMLPMEQRAQVWEDAILETKNLTLWVRDYAAASPWTGSSSAGSSGTATITASPVPIAGSKTWSGKSSANFNGSSNRFAGPTMSTLAAVASFSGWVFCRINRTSATYIAPITNSTAISNSDTILATNGTGQLTLIVQDSGSGRSVSICTFGASGNLYATTAITYGDWHLIQFRSNGTTQSIRVDGGAWSSSGGQTINSLAAALDVGRNPAQSIFLNGVIAEIGLSQQFFSDQDFNDVLTYATNRYGLALDASTWSDTESDKVDRPGRITMPASHQLAVLAEYPLPEGTVPATSWAPIIPVAPIRPWMSALRMTPDTESPPGLLVPATAPSLADAEFPATVRRPIPQLTAALSGSPKETLPSDPSGLPLTGWWRDFSGLPQTGTASTGTSAGESLIHDPAGSDPLFGENRNGHGLVRFVQGGTPPHDCSILSTDPISSLMSPNAWTIAAVVCVQDIPAPAIFCALCNDIDEWFVVFASKSTSGHIQWTVGQWNSALKSGVGDYAYAISTTNVELGTYAVVQMRYDGTRLWIRTNQDAWSFVATTKLENLTKQLQFSFGCQFLLADFIVTDQALSDASLDTFYGYAVARYGAFIDPIIVSQWPDRLPRPPAHSALQFSSPDVEPAPERTMPAVDASFPDLVRRPFLVVAEQPFRSDLVPVLVASIAPAMSVTVYPDRTIRPMFSASQQTLLGSELPPLPERTVPAVDGAFPDMVRRPFLPASDQPYRTDLVPVILTTIAPAISVAVYPDRVVRPAMSASQQTMSSSEISPYPERTVFVDIDHPSVPAARPWRLATVQFFADAGGVVTALAPKLPWTSYPDALPPRSRTRETNEPWVSLAFAASQTVPYYRLEQYPSWVNRPWPLVGHQLAQGVQPPVPIVGAPDVDRTVAVITVSPTRATGLPVQAEAIETTATSAADGLPVQAEAVVTVPTTRADDPN